MSLWLAILLLVIGFALLIWGADFFVDGASRVAARLKIPQIVIGLTIVAFGTSAPEAAVSISAGLKGSADLAVSNVVGSNIFNILFVLGTTALITPVTYTEAFIIDNIVAFVIALLLWILVLNKDCKLKRIGGAVLLVSYVIYFIYLMINPFGYGV